MKTNYKVDYERVYLLQTRLASSYSKEFEEFLKLSSTQKMINYSVSLTLRKNYWGLKIMGIERDDLQGVAYNLAAVFYSKYLSNFETEKSANYAFCRFLGQKLSSYISISQKKLRCVFDNQSIKSSDAQRNMYVLTSNDVKFHEFEKSERDVSEHFVDTLVHAKPNQIKKMIKVLQNKPESEMSDLIVESCLTVYLRFDIRQFIFTKESDIGYYLTSPKTHRDILERIKKLRGDIKRDLCIFASQRVKVSD